MNSLTRPERIELARAYQERECRRIRTQHALPGGLIKFVRYFWRVLEPVTPFVDGWCIEGMCEHLEAVSDGRLTRLLINVPPGFMKPVQVDELILTAKGFVRLGDIRVGDEVLTHRGRFRPVLEIHEQGILPLLKVTTESGRAARTAPDHPFLTTRGWIPARDLKKDDYLGVPHVEGFPEKRTMSSEEARLIGYLVGDGSIGYRALSFVNAEKDVIADFISCAEACGFHAYETIHPAKKVQASKIVLKSGKTRPKKGTEPPVLDWLRKHGLYCSNSYTKLIPDAVMASGPDAISNFLGAYWSCDGTVKVRHEGRKRTMMASCTTVSRRLAEDIQRALMVLNIHADLRFKQVKLESIKQPGGIYRSYDVRVCNRNEVCKIAELPGLCERKRLIAKQAFRDRFDQAIYEENVTSVIEDGEGECRCLTVDEDCSFTVNGLAVHNSMLLNVWWPAWEWGARNRPDLRYVAFSYSQTLTERDNEKFVYLLQSPEYRELYGHRVKVVKEGVGRISNTARGWKFASSVGGVGTGERADRILADDLHKVSEAESEVVREDTTRWFRESMQNRLNDLKSGVIIVLGQRVNEADVSGVIIEEYPNYEHLCVPMEFAEPACETSIGWRDPRRYDGELAWAERYPDEVLGPYRSRPYLWAGQYQQRPEPRGGGIIKRDYWRLWDRAAMAANDVKPGMFPTFEFVLASFDGAHTEKEENDYSALTIWGAWIETSEEQRYNEHFGTPRLMLIWAWRKRLTLHGTDISPHRGETKEEFEDRRRQNWGVVEHIAADCRKHKVDKLIIENKATGHNVEQEMRRLFSREAWTVALHDPGRMDKVARAYTVQHLFADGLIWRPDTDWAQLVEDELASLPRGAHDDLADSSINAIMHMRRMNLAQRKDESHAAIEEMLFPSKGPPRRLHYEG